LSSEEEEVIRVEGRFMNRWGEKVLYPQLKGKISFDESVTQLVNKVMMCSGEDFPEAVHRLYNSLPSSWLDEEFLDRVPDCNEEVEILTPQFFCGVVISEEVLPGSREVKTETDFHKLFGLILDLLDRRNLLVAKERHEYLTSEKIKNKGETPREEV
jgi:hypothetical protein